MKSQTLACPAQTRAFYEDRYRNGYMDRWDHGTRDAVAEVLAGLEAADGTRILDLGCGAGSLTDLIQRVHPESEVHGCDPSRSALDQAASRVPSATFFRLDQDSLERHSGSYDMVFTHHVLEHVFDLSETAATIDSLLKPRARMLHILPCGNPGSLHHRICGFYEDGIERDAGNRFFFEDPGHLRRLTTEQLVATFEPFGFRAVDVRYRCHFWDAIRLITQGSAAEIRQLLAPRRSRRGHRARVAVWLAAMMVLFAARAPVLALDRVRDLLRRIRSGARRATARRMLLILCVVPLALVFYLPSAGVEWTIRQLARREARRRKHSPEAAEMFVVLERR